MVIQDQSHIKNVHFMSVYATYLVFCPIVYVCFSSPWSVTIQCPGAILLTFDQLSHGSCFGLVDHKRSTFHTRRVWKTTQLCEYVTHCNCAFCVTGLGGFKMTPVYEGSHMHEIWFLVRKKYSPYTLFNIRWPKHFLVMVVYTKQCFECVLVTVRELFIMIQMHSHAI